MKRMKRLAVGSLLLVILAAGGAMPGRAQKADDKVTAKLVSYADLGKYVRGLKGKVVVVDFWADT
jgi:hypothetical protein